MEYHKDRFADHSIIFFQKNNIIAILPASSTKDILFSHGGLTFGGLIYTAKLGANHMIEILHELVCYMQDKGFSKIIYKPSPYIFHALPAQEDLYALHGLGAKFSKRELSTALSFENPIKFAKGKREGIKKALHNNLTIKESSDFDTLFSIGKKIMRERHNLTPVHTGSEMRYLHEAFPENIKMYLACKRDEVFAGTIIFDHGKTVHTQYMYNTELGMECGALDFLISHVISFFEGSKKFLSFGISTEKNGEKLNTGLQRQKEMFGGRSILHDTYELSV